ncbi:membrane protein [Paenibacillus baekrokdamisoli]|uniref:Membrane protein n=1 Tax=Paenibacillus baekrokdamisoli TaxID=1712516 RepID=A0A3G9IXB0_9BACL|nr:DHHW family protein [Paenibacillus baekrokdamisoli]MBB3067990.1 hypothetical protein [Paenibacillus baekrokdamisoli]BBH22962.1 membrane protein [Paenibacillus baekrokdamisoli]
MKSRADRILIGGFVAVLFSMSLLFVILPYRSFSEVENRPLQHIPQLSWANIWSKTFSEETENFITDHFPLRTEWVWAKSVMEQLRLQQENNGVYKGKDGYLFEKFAEPSYKQVQQYTEAVKQFAQAHPEVDMTFLLAPTSSGMYPEKMPWLAPIYSQAKVNAFIAEQLKGSLSFMNGFDTLSSHVAEQLYYRTDHHWTTHGAYLAYAAYARKMGWKPLAESDFTITTVTDSFLGSYHTKSQFAGLKPDSIQAYIPKNPVDTSLYIADTNQTFASLYDFSFLAKKDKYSYFLGGVHALMKITSKLDPQTVKQEKLLVIKDSYAHSFIPFLTLHVPEIDVIDIRYYNGSISKYMLENGITKVLFLFNTTTFIDNNAIMKLS